MSKKEIDAYLVEVPEPQKSTLKALRKMIQAALPGAVECITYGVPTFKVDGEAIAGFAAYKNHCTYFPMSGSVLTVMKEDVAKYETSSGALKFAIDKPLPSTLVKRLINVRIKDVAAKESQKR
jgi:uncharacterized protein YdhG (YjbR/CyaY superfamily)